MFSFLYLVKYYTHVCKDFRLVKDKSQGYLVFIYKIITFIFYFPGRMIDTFLGFINYFSYFSNKKLIICVNKLFNFIEC